MDKTEIVKNIRSWGGCISDAILNPKCRIFNIPTVRGLIGYHQTPGYVLVMGDPICSLHDREKLVRAFHQFCEEKKLTIIYLVVTQNFKQWAMQTVCQSSIEFGEEISMNPADDPRKKKGPQAVLIRKKIKRAVSDGTVIHEYTPFDKNLETAMEQVAIDWLKNRTGAQIYISPIHLFEDTLGKRWFYAQKEEKIVGVAALHELQAKKGWLLNHLVTTPEASNGTSELLIASVCEKLAQEEYEYLTFGIVPAHNLGEIQGFGKISNWISRLCFKIAQKIFNLKGRKKFWEKLDPQCEPSYILFDKPSLKIKGIIGLFQALNAER